MTSGKRLILVTSTIMLCCGSIMADSIMDRMRTRDFGDMDYISYLLTMWYNDYFNYPLVVRISVLMILFCCVAIILFTASLITGRTADTLRRKEYQQLYRRYFDLFAEIVTSEHDYTRQEIEQRLQLTQHDMRRRKNAKSMFLGCRLLIQVKVSYYDEYRLHNLTQLCHVLGAPEFLERMLCFGSRSQRVRALQVAQFLMIDLPESVLVRLLDSVSTVLRKETRMYYIWLSDSRPFRFIEDADYNYEYRQWDALELHFLLEARRSAGKEMPSLAPVIANSNNEHLQACLIREVGYWGNEEELDSMKKYLGYKSLAIRQAAIECMTQGNVTSAEPLLMSTYTHQPERLRLYTLRALVLLKTGRAIPFFLRAWKESLVLSTKLNILMALSMYNDEGRAQLEQLETQAHTPEEHLLFEQVRVFDKYIQALRTA